MKNSKRLLATLLTLCIMASFVCTGTAFAADGDVTLTFPAQIVNVNGTAQVVSNVSGATFTSSDSTIATVDATGVVTGKKIGRVTISATKNGTTKTVEIPVVGENLLGEHGTFANGTDVFSSEAAYTRLITHDTPADNYWWVPGKVSTYSPGGVSVVDGSALSETGKAIKASFDTATAGNYKFSMRSWNKVNADTTMQARSIAVDRDKMYELSGHIKYDNSSLPVVTMRVIYADGEGNNLHNSVSYGNDTIGTDNTVTGNWQYWKTKVVSREQLAGNTYADPYAYVYIDSSSSSVQTGSIYLSDLSFHEVSYAPEFNVTDNSKDLSAMAINDTIVTEFKHLTNTGNEIWIGSTSNYKENALEDVVVSYDSTNASVATVTNKGVITMTGEGTADITATATVAGQTVTKTITVSVPSTPLTKVEFPAQIVNVGGTAQVVADTDKVTFTSSDNTIATVDATGVVTGKKIGRVTISATKNGTTKTVEIPVVGENLLGEHGTFANGTDVFSSEAAYTRLITHDTPADNYWWVPGKVSTYSPGGVSVVDGSALSETGKAIKASFDTATAGNYKFSMRSWNKVNADTTMQARSIAVDRDKMYELSGHIKYDNSSLPVVTMRVIYADGEGNNLHNSVSYGNDTIGTDNTVTGNWQYWKTKVVSREQLAGNTYADPYAYVYIDSSSSSVQTGSIYLSDLSFHEVSYAPEFNVTDNSKDLSAMAINDTIVTEFKHLTNTGNEIWIGSTSNYKENALEDVVVSYDSTNASVATVTNKGVITMTGEGTADITATATVAGQTVTKTITVSVPRQGDEDLKAAFNVTETPINDYIAPTVTTITINGVTDVEPVLQADGSYKIEAPATNAAGKAFLYWAKAMSANEKIVSLSNIVYYVPEEDGRNILAAVYEGDVNLNAPKCYNANGQYFPDAKPIAADLPSMAGYGTATEWVQYKDTNIYVAQYGEKIQPDNVTVTVDGTPKNVPYGTSITCKADSAKANFKCWTKSDINGKTEIVSVEKNYTFKAWEDCTVTAVYVEHTPLNTAMKIIIDSFTAGNETGVMAEFIGFGNNVVEKGIMFNNERIAMATVGNQFNVIADENGTYKGYVIVDNGDDGYTLITDGLYTKSN